MSMNWEAQTISQIATSKYSLSQFITDLQDSRQLDAELARARALCVWYSHTRPINAGNGQYLANPSNLNHRNNRSRSRSQSAYRKSYSPRSPYDRDNRTRPPSPYEPRYSTPRDSRRDPIINPNFQAPLLF